MVTLSFFFIIVVTRVCKISILLLLASFSLHLLMFLDVPRTVQ